MNLHDRRMDISALCCAEEPALLPPLAPVRHGSPKQPSMYASAAAASTGGKSPSKKRSRRLSNSERGKLYRSRRKNYVQALEEQVEQLKHEVDQLNLYGCSKQQQQTAAWPLSRQPMGVSFASVVNEYFSLFKYGVPVAGREGGVVDAPQDQLLLSSRQQQQAGFLNGLMHPNMVFGSSYGVRELLDQWEKYSLYHAGLKYEVKNLQIMAADPNPVVLAPATLYVRFTRRTVEEIFPHVLWNEALVQRLIGLQIAYPVGNTFYFGDDNKIHRYDTYVDFVTAFVDVLGSVEDTMAMMESALIRQESMIGDLLEEPPRVKVEETQAVELAPRVELVDSDSSSNSGGEDWRPVGARIGMSLQGIL
ncbi:unnamed protein product [Phytophthora lilii]|uniref:Unnamed protein product n=1 Tax=Phytophthora lilii TaxID=2077276 RepID=A0A9W6TZE0_9STRA|nr:unnamed protein product [Phytophthora lilii]